MLKILINAYACCPGMGSEQGMSWNFISRLAKAGCELYVITESEYRSHIESWLHEDENEKSFANRIHFHFVPVGKTKKDSEKIRKMCWNQGTWSFYLKYAKWQKRALEKARYIIKDVEDVHGGRIDIIHQLNMAGFREPGMLYKINEEREKVEKKRIPLVWGPMTGYGSVPFSFMTSGGLKFTAFYLLKNSLNFLQLIGHHRVRKMIKSADMLISATPEMKKGLEHFYGVDAELMNEVGVDLAKNNDDEEEKKDRSDGKFRVLWVGRFMYTKQLELALRTIGRLYSIRNLEFHIVGKGFTDHETNLMHYCAKECEVEDRCVWHGQIPNSEVHKLMQECDLFFFTSIFEATSTVILEAIQNRLPIVCFDRCGFGPIVCDQIWSKNSGVIGENAVGIKIPCINPEQAICAFVDVIQYLYNNKDVRDRLSSNCGKKAVSLSWNAKIERLMEIYNSLVISD